jgi:hypothetical protein
VLFFISGCTPSNYTKKRFEALPTPKSNLALIYLYRGYNVTDAGFIPVIYINGKKYSQLHHTGYTYVYLKPGKHKFEARSEGMLSSNGILAGADLTAKGGETYYIKYAVTRYSASSQSGGMFGPAMDLFIGYTDTPDTLELVDNKVAERYIRNNYYVKPF